MMYWGPGFGWGWMMLGGLMMLAFWGGLIALGFFAVRALTRSGAHAGDTSSATGGRGDAALAILKERYARGEIDKEQYDSMRSDLLG